MNTIDRILVACDLSLATRDLLFFGVLLAEKHHAHLVLVHVIEQREPSIIKRFAVWRPMGLLPQGGRPQEAHAKGAKKGFRSFGFGFPIVPCRASDNAQG
mgnify:CR=1 FL=1